jgi:hypothetical protein
VEARKPTPIIATLASNIVFPGKQHCFPHGYSPWLVGLKISSSRLPSDNLFAIAHGATLAAKKIRS